MEVKTKEMEIEVLKEQVATVSEEVEVATIKS